MTLQKNGDMGGKHTTKVAPYDYYPETRTGDLKKDTGQKSN